MTDSLTRDLPTQRLAYSERRSYMRLVRVAVVAVAAVVLAACSTQTEPMYPGDSLSLGVPGDVIDVTPGVEYYPACSNEILVFEAVEYFPFTPSNASDFPYESGFYVSSDNAEATTDAAAQALAGGTGPSGMSRGTLPAVVAPGPGDDVGTLTRFENGFAYWISDNQLISTWLTTTELTYNWVC